MPGFAAGAAGATGSFFSTTSASVVRMVAANDAAFWRVLLKTFV